MNLMELKDEMEERQVRGKRLSELLDAATSARCQGFGILLHCHRRKLP